MNVDERALWEKIVDFDLDEPDALSPFSVKLARKNGWTLRYAQRAILEYKRFVFLAATASHAVCPSEEVDAVWHLHLCYTRSYWHGLCQGVLERPLHHEPTRGGGGQLDHHRLMYERTLTSYKKFFGEVPPTDLWPNVEERFMAGGRERHVNTTKHWILPKPSVRAVVKSFQLHTQQWLCMAGVGLLPVFGAIANPLDMQGPEFLSFFFWLALAAVCCGVAMRLLLRESDDGRPAPELDLYETAVLAHGVDYAITFGVTELALNDALKVTGTRTVDVEAGTGTLPQHVLPRRIYELAERGEEKKLSEIRLKLRPEASKIAAHLENEGLLESATSFVAGRWLPVLVMSGVLLLGLAKIAVGLSRDKPVVFLVLISLPVIIAIYKFYKIPLRTKRGNRVLAEQKKIFQDRGGNEGAEDKMDHQLWEASLFGLASMAAMGGVAAELFETLKSSGSSGGGCSTGCGDGGCGGGGCGGCGD